MAKWRPDLSSGLDLTDIETNKISLEDGITAPAAVVGQAAIYVDVADGNLKVIFGDGNIFTIAQDAATGTFRGALVTLSADIASADYTSAIFAIPFDNEAQDTDDIHDNSTNNTRLTVPDGVTFVELVGTLRYTGGTADDYTFLGIYKGGLLTYDGAVTTRHAGSAGVHNLTLSSPPLAVTGGDYFELFMIISTDTSIVITDLATSFSMKILE